MVITAFNENTGKNTTSEANTKVDTGLLSQAISTSPWHSGKSVLFSQAESLRQPNNMNTFLPRLTLSLENLLHILPEGTMGACPYFSDYPDNLDTASPKYAIPTEVSPLYQKYGINSRHVSTQNNQYAYICLANNPKAMARQYDARITKFETLPYDVQQSINKRVNYIEQRDKITVPRDSNGFPLYPGGPTGVAGPGFYWYYGPNFTADPCVTATNQNNEPAILLIRRDDNDTWALPGGMVEAGDQVTVTCKKELLEEALGITNQEVKNAVRQFAKELTDSGLFAPEHFATTESFNGRFDEIAHKPAEALKLFENILSIFSKNHIILGGNDAGPVRNYARLEEIYNTIFTQKPEEIYAGPVIEGRMADHAWPDTTAMHFHISTEDYHTLSQMIVGGDDATDAKFFTESEYAQLKTQPNKYGNPSVFAGHTDFIEGNATTKITGAFALERQRVAVENNGLPNTETRKALGL